jgi:V/A-type H+/Na+-transporting ATPase subunit I
VHGLRLNFIEFYNWGEPGEGYAFSAFRLEEVENE